MPVDTSTRLRQWDTRRENDRLLDLEMSWNAPDTYQEGYLKGRRLSQQSKYLVHELRFLSLWGFTIEQYCQMLGVGRDRILQLAKCAPVPAVTERAHLEQEEVFLLAPRRQQRL